MFDHLHAPKTFLSSESVTEGHPDKLCDQISDAVLDNLITQDKTVRSACEVATTTGLVFVFGEITTTASVDIPSIVRREVERIGYTDARFGFDFRTCAVTTAIGKQSPDIDAGVTRSNLVFQKLVSHQSLTEEDLDGIGAGDQTIVIGFACKDTPEFMPLPTVLAHKAARQLAEVRRASIDGHGPMPYLRPDGKCKITVQYDYGKPVRVERVVLSTQHGTVPQSQLKEDVITYILGPSLAGWADDRTDYAVNPSGRFIVGGPMGDSGLTGRKTIVDAYGCMARHGGGAFSGKDPTKVDRSAAYAARHVAKNIVAADLADICEVELTYAIGEAAPDSISVETYGTSKIENEKLITLIREHFDLRVAAIINGFDLLRPIYRQTACYGHFGRTDIDVPWERLDKVPALRSAVGAAI